MTEQGREQTCPHCRITEAKGSYCTRCLRPTEAEWKTSRERATAAVLGPMNQCRGSLR
jgi:hypothetical protein